jgi:hypothetical protein
MAFWDKALHRLGIKKNNELSIGDDTPLPRYAYGQFITGFQSFSDLLSPYRTLDPAQANEGRDNAIVSICINFIATSWQQLFPLVLVMVLTTKGLKNSIL